MQKQKNSNEQPPNLLYICDFPPSLYLSGGSIQISRLLESYPHERLTMLVSSVHINLMADEELWGNTRVVFPLFSGDSSQFINPLRNILNWLVMMPLLALVASMTIKRKQMKVMVSIAENQFFIAAALASIITGVPLVLIVHDDWVANSRRKSRLLKPFARPLFKWAVRTAKHLYAVSPGMQTYLKQEYGVSSELQLPAIDTSLLDQTSPNAIQKDSPNASIKIVYAGQVISAMADSLESLIRLVVNKEMMARYGLPNCTVHLHTKALPSFVEQCAGLNKQVFYQGWVSPEQMRAALSTADMLFLPFSFCEEERPITTTSFPSKTANYLAAQRPILIFAPPHSSLVPYAQEHGFAEIVDKPDPERLAQAIVRLATSSAHTEMLLNRAKTVLHQNHNIGKQRTNFLRLVTQLTS